MPRSREGATFINVPSHVNFMVSKEIARNVLKTYGEAWVEQNVDKILSIFTEDGIYHEMVLSDPFVGHDQIRQYWQSKVVEEQSDIQFKLLNYYIDGDVIIAEWDASFNSNLKKARIHIKEVAILEMKGSKIRSLREYWRAEKSPLE